MAGCSIRSACPWGTSGCGSAGSCSAASAPPSSSRIARAPPNADGGRRGSFPDRTLQGDLDMAVFSRKVDVLWNGGIMDGNGEAKAGTGAFSLPVTFPSRIGEPAGKTSPEELLAASHAACYAMALNGTLGRKGASADRTLITATITADRGDAGIKIMSSKLTAVAYGLKGAD